MGIAPAAGASLFTVGWVVLLILLKYLLGERNLGIAPAVGGMFLVGLCCPFGNCGRCYTLVKVYIVLNVINPIWLLDLPFLVSVGCPFGSCGRCCIV